MSEITIDDRVLAQARRAAAAEGFPTVERFVEAAILESVDARRRKRFFEGAAATREAMERAGLTEEEILEDFERFRNELWASGPPADRP